MLANGKWSWCTTSPLRSYVMLTKLLPSGKGPMTALFAVSPLDRLYFRGYPDGRKDIWDCRTHNGNGSSAQRYAFWQ